MFHRHRQECETLTDVVVQVPGNPGALRLLGFDEAPAHAGHRFFRKLALRDVLDRPAQPRDAAGRIPLWLPACRHPSMRAIGVDHLQNQLEGCARTRAVSTARRSRSQLSTV